MQPRPGSQDSSRPRHGWRLSRAAIERAGLSAELFAPGGGLQVGDTAAARALAEGLRAAVPAATPLSAGLLMAVTLLHELLATMVERYRRQLGERLTDRALSWLEQRLGRDRVESTLASFTLLFPPPAVLRGELTVEQYLDGETGGVAHRELLLEALLLLRLANENPALAPWRELFADDELAMASDYRQMIETLEEFFEELPPYGIEGLVADDAKAGQSDTPSSLIDRLRAPLLEAAQSLSGQLALLRPAAFDPAGPPLERVLRASDLLREEERPVFPPGPGPVEVIRFAPPPQAGRAAPGEPSQPQQPESIGATLTGPERFTADRDWMPRLVLIAKNVFVWLHQLSERAASQGKPGEPLTRLDEIPDSALDELAEQGITGLWLIGVWQRSAASERIKKLCGNPEAAASAYSLDDYRIADELGGEEALQTLAERATARGIRLASDMVPNHMGIDSHWVLEHPERFLSLPRPPFPGYHFGGPDLSPDPRVGIYLEDHYYDRSDAAVVFQRVDRESGEVRYLYHGNDGTSTPWNDTAQLDYLDPAVRETVIETILAVARRFPVVRFDAAMTLARRHVQRLWFPPPGQGGAIPSRSEHGLTQEEFDRRMPEEFWRQVVDRAAEEAPDTLLLAEAFWLMESYFVRSLGMHRVYNSAFMHMLRDERNADYRESLANVLEYDPRILQRYVNFMSNPDERTAFDQFGAGDKYFGVCTLMATLPGLPMFGHGQLEGLVERYGMEYRRPYRDERPDRWLLTRHRRRIAPLLAQRALFAEADHFRLYDFELETPRPTTPGGRPQKVDPNVFAYTNRRVTEGLPGRAVKSDMVEDDAAASDASAAPEPQRALIVFHNHAGTTRGRLRRSLPFAVQAVQPARGGAGDDARSDGGPARGDQSGDATASESSDASEALNTQAASSEADDLPPSDAKKLLKLTTLGEELRPAGSDPAPDGFLLACRDAASGLEHLFDPAVIAVDGLALELGPYQCHAFVDFRRVEASERWRELAAALAGTGVPNLDEALLEIELLPVLGPYRHALEPELLGRLAASEPVATIDEIEHRAATFYAALAAHLDPQEAGGPAPASEPAAKLRADLDATVAVLGRLQRHAAAAPESHASAGADSTAGDANTGDASTGDDGTGDGGTRDDGTEDRSAVDRYLAAGWTDNGPFRVTLVAWLIARQFGAPRQEELAASEEEPWPAAPSDSTPAHPDPPSEPPLDKLPSAASLIDRFLLDRELSALLTSDGSDEQAAIDARLLFRLLARDRVQLPEMPVKAERSEPTEQENAAPIARASPLAAWLRDPDVAAFLRLHAWEGVEYLHRESLEILCWWSVLAAACFESEEPAAAALDAARRLLDSAATAGYRVAAMLDHSARTTAGPTEPTA
jgi:glycosidase